MGHSYFLFLLLILISYLFIFLCYFRLHIRPDFEILSQSMHLITSIINFKDPELGSFLNSAKVDPFYATRYVRTLLIYHPFFYQEI